MKKIRIEKIVINIGFAKVPERSEAAMKLIGKMTGKQPVMIKSIKRNTGPGFSGPHLPFHV